MKNIPKPYLNRFHGDLLQTEVLINRIEKIVFDLILNKYSHAPDEAKRQGEYLIDAASQARMYAKAFDRIFNTPPIEENEIRRNGPSICLYNDKGELELVNETYLKLVGIESGDQAKELVRQGKLVDYIYTAETAKEVRAFVASIDATGGYKGKIFPLKNGKAARWTSLSTGELGGNVRVAEDVSGVREEDIPAPLSLDAVDNIPFLFAQSAEKFKARIEKIIIPLPTDMKIPLAELQKLSQVADIIVDKGPFFVVVKEGDRYISVNQNYVAATGYSLEELEKNPKLYYADQNDQVNARIMSLQKKNEDNDEFYQERTHYHDTFRMRRKDGTSTNASWDTFRISSLDTDPMATVRIGSMIASAQEIEGEKELQDWFKSQGL
ncbi:MAG: PAS domain S-box protein [Candidatus Gracilibacteria bacterium]|nr:PAS domain S-box protein [Candidatus Gracilibacteria bacterium]